MGLFPTDRHGFSRRFFAAGFRIKLDITICDIKCRDVDKARAWMLSSNHMKPSAVQTKRRLQSVLADFPVAKMPVAIDFLEYLKRQDEEMDATEEILKDKALMKEIRAVQADLKKNGRAGLTSWRSIQRYV